MRGGAPIDMAGAFERFIGTYAVKVTAAAALTGFDFAGDIGQQRFESRLRVDGGIDRHFAPMLARQGTK